jgi:hypothetical protein
VIKIFNINIFYLKFKVNNKNDMVAHAFWAVFLFQPSQIGPSAENDSAAIPPPIFFLVLSKQTILKFQYWLLCSACQW